MASLTLKNLSEDLMDRLRGQAARNRRSLLKEAVHLLDWALRLTASSQPNRLGEPMATYGQPPYGSGAPPDPEKLRARQLEQWRELCGQWESEEPVGDEIAAIVGARTTGREVEL